MILDFESTSNLAGPVLVTVAYFGFWYYLLLFKQRGTKYRLKEKYEQRGEEFDRYFGNDREMLAADRVVINTQEQMVPFLFSLWLHALFVSATGATLAGAIYIMLRAGYPVLLGNSLSHVQSKRVYWVTLPCYMIIFYLLGSAAWTAIR